MQDVIQRLTDEYPGLSPQLKQAARYVLDQPAEVAINSMRRVATNADVAPSTMLRLAKALDYPTYEAFRKPFREAMRGRSTEGFGDRARWLQEMAESDDAGQLLGRMAAANLGNLEAVFQENDPAEFQRAAEVIRGARRVYAVGVGGGSYLAGYFYYLARMALPRIRLPAGQAGSLIDDLVELEPEDVVVSNALAPYMTVSVRSAEFIRERGASVVAICDSRAAPTAKGAAAILLTPTESPQFFPSYTGVTAVMETLMAFIVSGGDATTVEKIAEMERIRKESGIYARGAKG
ncbi:MAG: MurR/RpiR family transcriptional regulator [Magnetovibrio sp.]|nr:MurR/RpiR family transcriptional regulator [Magnetovibrio sp.]